MQNSYNPNPNIDQFSLEGILHCKQYEHLKSERLIQANRWLLGRPSRCSHQIPRQKSVFNTNIAMLLPMLSLSGLNSLQM